MSKLLMLLIGGVIVVGGGAALIISRGSDDNNVKVTNTATNKSQEVKTGSAAYVAVDACDVLTADIATQILGAGSTKGDTTAGNASTNDLSVSSCTYFIRPTTGTVAEQTANTKGVSILVRAAKSKAGADSNKAQFKTVPAGDQAVKDIGDNAFFSSTLGQLHVLKGNNWYIVSNYSGKATSGTVESDTALAKLIDFK